MPAGAAELVLVCEDLDAGRRDGRPFLHWVVTGLEGDLDGIGEGEDVEGARYGVNGFGNAGYDGPEPPPGETHRYAVHADRGQQPGGRRRGRRAGRVPPGRWTARR